MTYYMNRNNDRYNVDENKIMHRGELYYCYKRREDAIGSEMYTKKGRPCILVSSEDLCNHSPMVTVVYLSSSPKSDYPTHVVINSVISTSTAICEQLNTVSKARLGKLIGRISDLELKAIDRALAESQGLNYLIKDDKDATQTKLYEELLVTRTERDTYKRMVDTLIKSK